MIKNEKEINYIDESVDNGLVNQEDIVEFTNQKRDLKCLIGGGITLLTLGGAMAYAQANYPAEGAELLIYPLIGFSSYLTFKASSAYYKLTHNQ